MLEPAELNQVCVASVLTAKPAQEKQDRLHGRRHPQSLCRQNWQSKVLRSVKPPPHPSPPHPPMETSWWRLEHVPRFHRLAERF